MTFHPNPDHHDIMHCFIPFDQTTRVLRDSREDMMVGDLLNPRMTAPLIVCETGEGRVPFKLNRELIYLAGEYGYSDIIKTNAKFCDGQALTFDHRQFLKDMYPLCENATDGSEVCRLLHLNPTACSVEVLFLTAHSDCNTLLYHDDHA